MRPAFWARLFWNSRLSLVWIVPVDLDVVVSLICQVRVCPSGLSFSHLSLSLILFSSCPCYPTSSFFHGDWINLFLGCLLMKPSLKCFSYYDFPFSPQPAFSLSACPSCVLILFLSNWLLWCLLCFLFLLSFKMPSPDQVGNWLSKQRSSFVDGIWQSFVNIFGQFLFVVFIPFRHLPWRGCWNGSLAQFMGTIWKCPTHSGKPLPLTGFGLIE